MQPEISLRLPAPPSQFPSDRLSSVSGDPALTAADPFGSCTQFTILPASPVGGAKHLNYSIICFIIVVSNIYTVNCFPRQDPDLYTVHLRRKAAPAPGDEPRSDH